jgi:hypothetical protein
MFFFRPYFFRIKIYFDEDQINVRLINKWCFSIINIKIEICTVSRIEKTHHFDIDKENFLFLPINDNRLFKTTDLTPQKEEKIKNNTLNIRVRYYAAHSFTGFGRTFGAEFSYDAKTGKFIRRRKCCFSK